MRRGMEMQVEVTWVDGMEFRANSDSGHSWNMDASVEVGGNDRGPRPTELLLSAVGGCTGIDIVSILNKMQQPLKGLRIMVSGERAEEHPRRFTKVSCTMWSAATGFPMIGWPGLCSFRWRSTVQC